MAKANPSLSSARAQQMVQRMIDGSGITGSVGGAAGDKDHDGDSH